MDKSKLYLGIDVGATGIKAALVDIERGELVSERHRVKTPRPATRSAVTEILLEIVQAFDWHGQSVGCGFPAIIRDGRCESAVNIHSDWLGFDLRRFFKERADCHACVMNDADAAGMAEMVYGRGKNKGGKVLMLTLGTGIGSGLFYNGILIPNIELGQVPYKKGIVEQYASNRVREEKDLSWQNWGQELNRVLHHIERLLSPDLLIIGGGVSKKFDSYASYLTIQTEIKTAALLNSAGIIGAAYMAHLMKVESI